MPVDVRVVVLDWVGVILAGLGEGVVGEVFVEGSL